MNWFSPATYIGALFIGAGIGVLTGMFGVGGGFLATPLLTALLGIPVPYAVGTGLIQILGASTNGIYRRRKDGLIDYKLAITLFGGNYVGVRLGTQTLESLKDMGTVALKDGPVSAADLYTLIIYVVLLTAIAIWMLYDTSRSQPATEGQGGFFARIKIPPYTDYPSLAVPRLSIPALSYFGLLLGYLTGLLGVGGGVILLPALVYLVGMRTHRAAATSLLMVWFSSAIAVVSHTMQGNTRLDLAIPLLIGGSLGVQLGVTVCDRMGGLKLRRYFAWVVVVAVVVVAWKLLSLVF